MKTLAAFVILLLAPALGSAAAENYDPHYPPNYTPTAGNPTASPTPASVPAVMAPPVIPAAGVASPLSAPAAAAAPLSYSAAAAPVTVTVHLATSSFLEDVFSNTVDSWVDHGPELRFSLGLLSLYNGAPLSYTPFEIGWRFSNGVHLRTGLEIYFYNGVDDDPLNPGSKAQFTYSMNDWRTSLIYVVPLPLPVQPLAGITLEALWGSKQYTVLPISGTNSSSASWSGIGPGGLLGLQYQFGRHSAASLCGRYTLPFGAPGPLAAVDLGWHYLF